MTWRVLSCNAVRVAKKNIREYFVCLSDHCRSLYSQQFRHEVKKKLTGIFAGEMIYNTH